MGNREADGEENGEEGVDRSAEDSYADDYTRAKRLWARFIRGEITSKQLDEIVSSEHFGDDREESIGDLYGKNSQ